MEIEVKSSEMERIISKKAKLEHLGNGCQFSEGPVWSNKEGGFLLFSDIPANRMKKWTEKEGITDFRVPSGKSNGMTYDKQGRLITCEHANRRVSRTEPDGTIVTIASHYKGKKLNSPNDVVVKSDGSIYFSDPPYGLTAEFGVKAEQELDFQGVYRLSPDGATLTLLVDDFDRPNGLAFSPDESFLYIDDTARMHVRVFDVKPDGTITKGRLFAEEHGDEPGVPDGMKVDSKGNVYLSGPGGVWVFDPSGKHLGTMKTPEVVGNLCWGGSDWKTLFITASTSLYRVRMIIASIPVP